MRLLNRKAGPGTAPAPLTPPTRAPRPHAPGPQVPGPGVIIRAIPGVAAGIGLLGASTVRAQEPVQQLAIGPVSSGEGFAFLVLLILLAMALVARGIAEFSAKSAQYAAEARARAEMQDLAATLRAEFAAPVASAEAEATAGKADQERADLRAALTGLQTTLAAAEARTREVQTRLDALESRIAGHLTMAHADADGLAQRLDGVGRDLAALAATAKDQDARLARLDEAVQTTVATAEAAARAVAALPPAAPAVAESDPEAAVRPLREVVSALESRLAALEAAPKAPLAAAPAAPSAPAPAAVRPAVTVKAPPAKTPPRKGGAKKPGPAPKA